MPGAGVKNGRRGGGNKRKERCEHFVDVLLALFSDRWNDRAVTVGTAVLAVSVFLPIRSVGERIALGICAVLLAAVVLRSVWLAVRIRSGEPIGTEPPQAARRRERIQNAVWLAFFVGSLLVIVWKSLR